MISFSMNFTNFRLVMCLDFYLVFDVLVHRHAHIKNLNNWIRSALHNVQQITLFFFFSYRISNFLHSRFNVSFWFIFFFPKIFFFFFFFFLNFQTNSLPLAACSADNTFLLFSCRISNFLHSRFNVSLWFIFGFPKDFFFFLRVLEFRNKPSSFCSVRSVNLDNLCFTVSYGDCTGSFSCYKKLHNLILKDY